MIKLPTDMTKTVLGQDLIRIGRDEGRKKGREEGAASIVKRQAAKRFGARTQALARQIDDLDYVQLEKLSEALFELSSLADLKRWLKQAK